MDKKPLIVGELNPYGGELRHALFPYPANSTGHRLCVKVMGLTMREYLKSFDRVNLCYGKWSKFEAASVASNIKWSDDREDVILLGSKVCDAFGFPYAPFSTMLSKGKTFAILPHPSGLCRTWNEPGSYAKARRLLRKYEMLPKKKEKRP